MQPFIRASILAGVSVLAVSAAPAFAASTHPNIQTTQAKAHGAARKGTDRTLSVLYDQTSNPSGSYISSQNFGSGNTSNTAAADDFVVPEGQTWIVKEVDIPGVYFNGSGPAKSESVTFFKDKHAKVGKIVDDLEGLHGTDDFGSFAITLGEKGVKLKSGHYWVSVVTNMDFSGGGEWGWENQTPGTTEGDPAMWENPGGTKCQTWTAESVCFGASVGDQMFTLKGKAK